MAIIIVDLSTSTNRKVTPMESGQTKIFTKSGNEVRLVERSSEGEWVVERTQGASRGKRMICPERALVDSLEEESDSHYVRL